MFLDQLFNFFSELFSHLQDVDNNSIYSVDFLCELR